MQLKDQSYTYAAGTKLRVVQPNADTGLKKGDIVVIVENSGNNCPIIKKQGGTETFGCFWHRLETLDDSPETRPTPIATQYEDRAYPAIRPGARFVLVDAVGITRFNKGDVLELSKNDGSSFPFFKKVDRGVKVGRGFAIKWRRLAPVDLVHPTPPKVKGDTPTAPQPRAPKGDSPAAPAAQSQYPHAQAFIDAMGALLADYAKGKPHDFSKTTCSLCVTSRMVSGRSRDSEPVCSICPWKQITGRRCFDRVMGGSDWRAIRIQQLGEWIAKYAKTATAAPAKLEIFDPKTAVPGQLYLKLQPSGNSVALVIVNHFGTRALGGNVLLLGKTGVSLCSCVNPATARSVGLPLDEDSCVVCS